MRRITMTYPEAKQVLTGLLDAFDRDEHGDYFYDHGWEVCEAVILAMGAFEDIKVVKTNADHIRSMTDGELAELLHETDIRKGATNLDGWIDWLKQPYKEDT
jgi:hypothetical protein